MNGSSLGLQKAGASAWPSGRHAAHWRGAGQVSQIQPSGFLKATPAGSSAVPGFRAGRAAKYAEFCQIVWLFD